MRKRGEKSEPHASVPSYSPNQIWESPRLSFTSSSSVDTTKRWSSWRRREISPTFRDSGVSEGATNTNDSPFPSSTAGLLSSSSSDKLFASYMSSWKSGLTSLMTTSRSWSSSQSLSIMCELLMFQSRTRSSNAASHVEELLIGSGYGDAPRSLGGATFTSWLLPINSPPRCCKSYYWTSIRDGERGA